MMRGGHCLHEGGRLPAAMWCKARALTGRPTNSNWASCGNPPDALSTLYSVVLPSKCSLSASASARVWWTTPSR